MACTLCAIAEQQMRHAVRVHGGLGTRLLYTTRSTFEHGLVCRLPVAAVAVASIACGQSDGSWVTS